MGARPVSPSGLQPRGAASEVFGLSSHPRNRVLHFLHCSGCGLGTWNFISRIKFLNWQWPLSWWERGAHLFAASVWAVVTWTRLPHLWGPSKDPVRGEVACPGVERPRFEPEPTLAGALGSSAEGGGAARFPRLPEFRPTLLGPFGPTVGLGQCLAVPVPEASARRGLDTELGAPTDLPLTCQDSCQPRRRRAALQTPLWQEGTLVAGRAALRPHGQQPRTGPGQPRFGGVTPASNRAPSPGGCVELRAPAGTTPSFPAVSPCPELCAASRPPRTTAGPTCGAFVFGHWISRSELAKLSYLALSPSF